MINATEEKKAEKGLGNARLVEGGLTFLKRMLREGLNGEDDTQADVKMPNGR